MNPHTLYPHYPLQCLLSTKEAHERVAYEFCEDFAAQGGVYAEYRFNPYPAGDCRGEDYCEAIFAGLRRGQKDFGVKIRCIMCFLRHLPGEGMWLGVWPEYQRTILSRGRHGHGEVM